MKIFIFRCGFDAVKNITTKQTECNTIERERERERGNSKIEREREVIPK